MKLCEYRQYRSLTYDELATQLGLSKSTVWRICNGENTDTITAADISSATGGQVTIVELLYPNGLPDGAVIGQPAHCATTDDISREWGNLANGEPPQGDCVKFPPSHEMGHALSTSNLCADGAPT